MYEHNALGYWSGLALCLTKVRSSRACCPATALILYTKQKKKRNNRSPRIFEFKGKTLRISGLLLHDSYSWDIRV